MSFDVGKYLTLVQERDRQRYKFIAQTIKTGMAPFKPDNIRITIEETIPGYKVIVEISNLPNLRSALVIDPAELQQPTAEDMLHELGRAFFREFRKRQIEPDNNAELGQD